MSKEKVLQIIANTQIAFMASVDGKSPRVRPMSIQTIWNDKIYFSTYGNSRKMQQFKKNPKTEIVWMDKDMSHVRIAGIVKLCDDKQLKARYFEQNPDLKNYFKDVDDPNYALIEVKPEKVELMNLNDRAYTEVAW